MPQPLVQAGLLGVPVRVDERLHRAAAGQAAHRLRQRVRCAGRSTIDQQHALSAGLSDDVGLAGQADHEQIVGQPEHAGGIGRGSSLSGGSA
jgi:hypothetical protein